MQAKVTPAQLTARLKRREIAPAYLLLGTEAYQRLRLREALVRAVGGAADAEGSVTRHDLAKVSLAEVLDDARSLSLFVPERLIWLTNAEAALPRGRSEEDGESEASASDPSALADYLKDPTPGVVLVFEAIRYDFEGDDKRKQERVLKFYNTIPCVVELRGFTPDDARAETQVLAQRAGLLMDGAALELLVEALGADMARISTEIEKLALFAGQRPVGVDDVVALTPDARSAPIFALVNALGRRDRARSLDILDALSREGAYMPLALAFLSTQFRTALVAREAGLKSTAQIQAHFARIGAPVWASRADQAHQTAVKFTKPQLEQSLQLISEADRGLRDTRPDDRVIMEQLILRLTA
jgi:DNA polymerase III subunit delta